MARNNKLNLSKKILVFILSILMCLSLFFAAACSVDDDSSSTIPEYYYTDESDCDIANPDFTYGTANLTYADYPRTSITGWSISKNATSNSGVIDISNKGWTELMSSLVKDNGILNYVRSKNGNFTDADISKKMIEEFPDKYNEDNKPTTAQIKKYILDNYFLDQQAGVTFPFSNPGKHSGATDNKVYMLNNYKTNDIGYGCVQELSSSTILTIPASEYAKISVYVKTENLNTYNTNLAFGKTIGANIRIKNNFNTEAQSDFGFFNITASDWTEYTFYVKADSVYESKIALVLGLGYGDYAAEGTAYFDDITVELLDETEYLNSINNQTDKVETYTFTYQAKNNTDLQIEDYDETAHYLYDMSLNLISDVPNSSLLSYDTSAFDFTKNSSGSLIGNPTNKAKDEVFSISEQTNLTDIPYNISEGLRLELIEPASITFSLKNGAIPFELGSESYSSITFFVKNQLSKLYSKNIYVHVQKVLENNKTERTPAVVTISDISDDWAKCTVLVKNNSTNLTRKFYLDITVGPYEAQDKEDLGKFAKGELYLSNPIIINGDINQYADASETTELPNYKFFNLMSSTANANVDLANSSSSTETTPSAKEYSFPVASSDVATIQTKPATPKGYIGIQANSEYIQDQTVDRVIINKNDNSGLINSEYLSNYSASTNQTISGIASALNYNKAESIQPLMITPISDGTNYYSYGYMSNEVYTIYQTSYAKISVTLKVSEDAVANIYLIDVSKKDKDVLKFNEFTVNTTSGLFNAGRLNDVEQEKSMALTVTADMMRGQEWITVDFFIATGYSNKDFRIELWNGSREASSSLLTSNSYVFVESVLVSTENAFDQPSSLGRAFTDDTINNPLLDRQIDFVNTDNLPVDGTELIAHQRELTNIEKTYNADINKNGSNIVYQPKYIWAKTNTMIYAIYDTIDPLYINPYDYEPVEDETEESTAPTTDPATFWLSLSSILLGVALVIAIAMLFIKNILRRRKAARSDAKSHYTVRSRVKKVPTTATKTIKEQVDDVELVLDTEVEEQTENNDQTLDDYVYGDVQDFGEDSDK